MDKNYNARKNDIKQSKLKSDINHFLSLFQAKLSTLSVPLLIETKDHHSLCKAGQLLVSAQRTIICYLLSQHTHKQILDIPDPLDALRVRQLRLEKTCSHLEDCVLVYRFRKSISDDFWWLRVTLMTLMISDDFWWFLQQTFAKMQISGFNSPAQASVKGPMASRNFSDTCRASSQG